MDNEYYTYIGALRVFRDFSCQTNDYVFSYDYNASGYEQLRTKSFDGLSAKLFFA